MFYFSATLWNPLGIPIFFKCMKGGKEDNKSRGGSQAQAAGTQSSSASPTIPGVLPFFFAVPVQRIRTGPSPAAARRRKRAEPLVPSVVVSRSALMGSWRQTVGRPSVSLCVGPGDGPGGLQLYYPLGKIGEPWSQKKETALLPLLVGPSCK